MKKFSYLEQIQKKNTNGKWNYLVEYKNQAGETFKKSFDTKEERNSFIKAGTFQILTMEDEWEDNTPHKESTLF